MTKTSFAFIFVSFAVNALSTYIQKTPVFSDQYYVEGLLALPYAEIKEPFIAYFDGNNNRSRIDYYGDLVQTLQRADLAKTSGGITYKLAYMVDTAGDAQRVCFQINGTSDSPVTSQTVLPDLSTFSNAGSERCQDIFGKFDKDSMCERWEYSVTNGDKLNKYVFWLLRDQNLNPIPIQYLMKGYDSLLGSHYDKYEIYYKNYKTVEIDPKVFELSNNYTCRSFPGPGVEHIGLNNPIKEFINGEDKHIDNEFDKFINKHNKNYKNETHSRERKNIFRDNYRYILSKNRQNTNFKMSVNHLTDFTQNEMKSLRGRLYSGVTNNGGKHFDKKRYNLKDIPNQWDWRLNGAVTPVKDQAVCGSCWAFGTTGTIEGVYFVKTGHLVKLSEQELIDCGWNEDNNGCDGGEDFRAYDYIMKRGGISTEDQYGDYLGADGKCHDKEVMKSVQLNGFYNVTPGDPEALETALFIEGPVTVAIDASHKSLSFYSSGIYYEPECGNKPENLDHQVLAVGFGTLNKQRYWLIKNSWSTYWGNDGYVLMNQVNNNCGVLTSPTFPIIKN